MLKQDSPAVVKNDAVTAQQANPGNPRFSAAMAIVTELMDSPSRREERSNLLSQLKDSPIDPDELTASIEDELALLESSSAKVEPDTIMATA